MRSLLFLLSRLAVCGRCDWERAAAPFPQTAIWRHQTRADANLSISFRLFFFRWWRCSQGPLPCSCTFRPGPCEGVGAFGITPLAGLVGVSASLLPSVGLCGCDVRAALSNGNQAIMLHMGKRDRCRGFTPLVLSRGQRQPVLPGDG